MIRNKLIDYGVVYTPKDLAEFMAKIVHGICDRDGIASRVRFHALSPLFRFSDSVNLFA